MKIYLVGGAVRDILMKRTPEDKDYVIVGATPAELLDLEKKMFTKINDDGSREISNVGKSFPVYIHTETNDEYALARKELKVGEGYHGFTFEFDDSVSLEEDLMRRDLTVNSIAYDSELNKYIDPFNGMQDIKDKILRPTSNAFKEDPLRVLRVARFASKLKFSSSKELIEACSQIALSGELSTLNNKRITKELFKLFTESSNYEVFFKELNLSGSFELIFPSLKKNYSNLIDQMSKFSGSWISFCFLMYFNGNDDILNLFDFSKKDSKIFKMLKENYLQFFSSSLEPKQILLLIKKCGFSRKELAQNDCETIIRETFNLIEHKETNIALLKKCSYELQKFDFSKFTDKKNIKELIESKQLELINKTLKEINNEKNK